MKIESTPVPEMDYEEHIRRVQERISLLEGFLSEHYSLDEFSNDAGRAEAEAELSSLRMQEKDLTNYVNVRSEAEVSANNNETREDIEAQLSEARRKKAHHDSQSGDEAKYWASIIEELEERLRHTD